MSERQQLILMVDSDKSILHVTSNILTSLTYETIVAVNGETAFGILGDIRPNLVILGIRSQDNDAIGILQKMKENQATSSIPVIVMTQPDATEERKRALDAGANEFLNKPPDASELATRVKSVLKLNEYYDQSRSHQESLDSEVEKRTQVLMKSLEKIKAASLDTVYRLSRAAEYKDEDTGAHVQRMSHYSSAIARELGMDAEFVESVLWAAPMHDIGKIGIPDRVLQKPGKLDAEEWDIMKQHSLIGSEILKDANADFIIMGAEIAISHHEKWDGSGYPQGKAKTDIPLAGRIVALADVFDALTSARPYKDAFPLEKALSIIKECHSSHFDPDIVDAFFVIQDEIISEFNWWKFISPENESDGTLNLDFLDLENL